MKTFQEFLSENTNLEMEHRSAAKVMSAHAAEKNTEVSGGQHKTEFVHYGHGTAMHDHLISNGFKHHTHEPNPTYSKGSTFIKVYHRHGEITTGHK